MGKVITGHCAAVAAAQHRMKTWTNVEHILIVVFYRIGCEGEFMDWRRRMDVTQSEGDLPDLNQSEH